MARRFEFRLEAVLKLRRRRCDACRRRVADGARRAQEHERRLAALRERLQRERRAGRSDARSARLDPVRLGRRQLYVGHLDRSIEAQTRALEQLRRDLELQRRALADASRELKVMETLRERQWRRHCEAEAKAETLEQDELAVQRFRTHRGPYPPEMGLATRDID